MPAGDREGVDGGRPHHMEAVADGVTLDSGHQGLSDDGHVGVEFGAVQQEERPVHLALDPATDFHLLRRPDPGDHQADAVDVPYEIGPNIDDAGKADPVFGFADGEEAAGASRQQPD